jgi:hypothetical protein
MSCALMTPSTRSDASRSNARTEERVPRPKAPSTSVS